MKTVEPFSKRFPDESGIKPKADPPPEDRPKRDVLKLAELIHCILLSVRIQVR